MKLLGYKLTPSYPIFPVQKKIIINTINPHSYCVAKKDKAFGIASTDFSQEKMKASVNKIIH